MEALNATSTTLYSFMVMTVPRNMEPDAEREAATPNPQLKVLPVILAPIIVAIIMGTLTPKGSAAY